MCTDELDPISPFKCPRGKGGVAILWNNKISNEITTLPDCNQRMMAIRVANELCIINVYMPARGLSDSDLEFESCLDEIAEIIIKYGGNLDIMLGGDINASLHRRKYIKRDLAFHKFSEEFCLKMIQDYPETPTFHNFNGTSSQLDYILTMKTERILNVNVTQSDYLNTSTHKAIQAKVALICAIQKKNLTNLNKKNPNVLTGTK